MAVPRILLNQANSSNRLTVSFGAFAGDTSMQGIFFFALAILSLRGGVDAGGDGKESGCAVLALEVEAADAREIRARG